MNILPWSPSALNAFETCPSMYEATYVTKEIQWVPSKEADHGNFVHKAFEDFFNYDKPLPPSLTRFTPYLARIDKKPGCFYVELKAAFDKKAQPCSWDIRKEDLWARFKIDYLRVNENGDVPIAQIWDFKSGKRKEEMRQLIIYALYAFAMFPEVEIVDVRYFWMIDFKDDPDEWRKAETRVVWRRSEVPELWAKLMPLLLQYREAFKTNTWQKRRSGLCNGFCGRTTCENWQPKRETR